MHDLNMHSGLSFASSTYDIVHKDFDNGTVGEGGYGRVSRTDLSIFLLKFNDREGVTASY